MCVHGRRKVNEKEKEKINIISSNSKKEKMSLKIAIIGTAGDRSVNYLTTKDKKNNQRRKRCFDDINPTINDKETNEMTKELFEYMIGKATKLVSAEIQQRFINDNNNNNNSNPFHVIELISGGAAWSDHVAVHLFLNKNHFFHKEIQKYNCYFTLTLHLPTLFNTSTHRFYDNGGFNWQTNPGKITNLCHQKFSSIIYHNEQEKEGRLNNNITLCEISKAITENKEAKVITHSGFHARNSGIANSCDVLIAFSFGCGDIPTSKGTLNTYLKCKKDTKKIHVSLTNQCQKRYQKNITTEFNSQFNHLKCF